jgi:hypothetical protein
MNSCPVCESAATVNGPQQEFYKIKCPKCGIYTLTCETLDDLPSLLEKDKTKRALLSHKICRSQINNRRSLWEIDKIKSVLEKFELPSVSEQMDGILEWIGNESKYPGDPINFNPHPMQAYAGIFDSNTVHLYLKWLSEKDLIRFYSQSLGSLGSGFLSYQGLQRFDQLTRGKLAYDKAFMAMKFGDPDLNTMLEDYFKPAVEQTGYRLLKLDDQPEAGLIDIRIRQEIKTSKFIIADLTHDNLGAYWEAGFAEGIGKQVIYTCRRDKFESAKTHFDVNHHLTITWDANNPSEAAQSLKAAIRYTFPEAKQEDN